VTHRRQAAATVCHVLQEDVSLAEAIPVADRDKAIEECIAAVVRIPRGRWSGLRTDSTLGIVLHEHAPAV
jgi:hypothetical protein